MITFIAMTPGPVTNIEVISIYLRVLKRFLGATFPLSWESFDAARGSILKTGWYINRPRWLGNFLNY